MRFSASLPLAAIALATLITLAPISCRTAGAEGGSYAAHGLE